MAVYLIRYNSLAEISSQYNPATSSWIDVHESIVHSREMDFHFAI